MEAARRRSRTSSSGQTVCRKHPKHRQSPGVCSACVAEKLSKLLNGAVSRTDNMHSRSGNGFYSSSSSSSLSSLSSSCGSSETSSHASPVHRHFRGGIGLVKSKSTAAFVARRRGGGGGGFLSIFRSRSKRMINGCELHLK
ncbi:hypothetical protein DM860_009519 [Cuscuta australis]|uniref:Uncharacterized protein n=1 Tax=Cuscuta australis TaxID=267555 RepID=A0A328DIN4_9ASTE|nr:hypothetical protein DM860_009519 [Cuscuta australis]